MQLQCNSAGCRVAMIAYRFLLSVCFYKITIIVMDCYPLSISSIGSYLNSRTKHCISLGIKKSSQINAA